MPTENELKFILRLDPSLQPQIEAQAYDMLRIEQGYLKRGSKLIVRVRKQESTKNGTTHYLLQTKFDTQQSVDFNRYLQTGEVLQDQPGRVIEITSDISERDFIDFWQKTKGTVLKCRYLIQSQTAKDHKDENGKPWQEVWEVDFFSKPRTGLYFALAEVELPEGVMEPLFSTPELLRQNTVFRVPVGDSRFTNSRLGNVKYASRLYESLFAK